MARPSTRQELIDYCLRALGEPVLEVNVDPDQLEDRVDQAIQYFIEYHTDGVQRAYITHEITQDVLDNGYITINDTYVQVLRVLPMPSAMNSAGALFDVQYQMMMDAVNNGFLLSGDLAYYEQLQQHLALVDLKLNGSIQHTWSRYSNSLKLHGELGQDIKLGDFIVVEAFVEVRPSVANQQGNTPSSYIYDNMFLKEYTTALIKQQWGANLIKFEGMQLPGGITLNGRQLFDDATQEIKDLQERLRSEFEAPVDFFIG